MPRQASAGTAEAHLLGHHSCQSVPLLPRQVRGGFRSRLRLQVGPNLQSEWSIPSAEQGHKALQL